MKKRELETRTDVPSPEETAELTGTVPGAEPLPDADRLTPEAERLAPEGDGAAPVAETVLSEENVLPAENVAAEDTTDNAYAEENESFADNVRIISPMRLVLQRFFRSRLSMVGLVTMVLLLLFCFMGPLFIGWGEQEVDSNAGSEEIIPMTVTYTGPDGEQYEAVRVDIHTYKENKFAPCFNVSVNENGKKAVHILGTDDQGYDVLVRLMYGGRISLSLSLLVVLVNTLIGVVLGGLAGFFGKWVDMLIMRIVDIINCIPTLPILLIISAILSAYNTKGPEAQAIYIDKSFNIYILMGVLTLISWTGAARLVRGQILSLREQEYMTACEALGVPNGRRIFKHLVPNIMPQLIVSMTLSLGSMILYEATLGYLDLGVPYPKASWGNIIFLAKKPNILSNFPNIWIPAGICIVLAVLAFNFIGDGLRDALDPRMKR